MSGAVYGGDEVGAVVVELGSYNTKAGFAGEDTPKAVFPTLVGCREVAASAASADGAAAMDTSADGTGPKSSVKRFVGYQNLASPREGLDLKPLLDDGLISDWDLAEELLNYTFRSALQCDVSDRPIMFAEPAWNTKDKREKLCELLFEKYNCPAAYLCKNPVLSAFAAGRSSGLILDSGAQHTSAVPVYDGLVIKSGIRRNNLAGDFLTEQYRVVLDDEMKVETVPYYQVASKSVVGEGEAPVWTARKLPTLTQSYREFMIKETVRDLQISIARISDQPYKEATLRTIPTTPYEFPNGYNYPFALARYRVPEALFNPEGFTAQRAARQPGTTASTSKPPIGHQNLLTQAINSCDVDVHQNLWGSIVLAGANTLHTGYQERLLSEVQRLAPPGTKFKVIATPSAQERMFSSWVGGSILASLGSFQQMWVSKVEYNEGGKKVLDQKCP